MPGAFKISKAHQSADTDMLSGDIRSPNLVAHCLVNTLNTEAGLITMMLRVY